MARRECRNFLELHLGRGSPEATRQQADTGCFRAVDRPCSQGLHPEAGSHRRGADTHHQRVDSLRPEDQEDSLRPTTRSRREGQKTLRATDR
jgi:hypothetical protein